MRNLKSLPSKCWRAENICKWLKISLLKLTCHKSVNVKKNVCFFMLSFTKTGNEDVSQMITFCIDASFKQRADLLHFGTTIWCRSNLNVTCLNNSHSVRVTRGRNHLVRFLYLLIMWQGSIYICTSLNTEPYQWKWCWVLPKLQCLKGAVQRWRPWQLNPTCPVRFQAQMFSYILIVSHLKKLDCHDLCSQKNHLNRKCRKLHCKFPGVP